MIEMLIENLSFVAVSVAVFAGLVLAALAGERLAAGKLRHWSTSTVVYIGVFAALAGVLMMLDIPLFFAPMFYKLDLSEIPALICAFSLGPVAGVVCEFMKVVIKLLLKGSTTAFVGDFASFVVGCSMVLPSSVVYQRFRTKKGAVAGLVCGGLVMTVFGSLFNAFYLLPKFAELYGISMDSIVAMGTQVNGSITSVSTLVLFAVVPFNLLKAVAVSFLTMLLYKRVRRFIKVR